MRERGSWKTRVYRAASRRSVTVYTVPGGTVTIGDGGDVGGGGRQEVSRFSVR